jgi:hypothetical protein
MGIDATMTRQSYAPGQLAALRVSTDRARISIQIAHTGPEKLITYADNQLEGVDVTSSTGASSETVRGRSR